MLELANMLGVNNNSNYYDELLRQQASGLSAMQFQSHQNTIKNIDKILNDEKLLLLTEE